MSLLLALILPFALWLLLCLVLRSDAYAMDQGYNRGSFWPLMIMYAVFFYAIAFTAFVAAGVEFYRGMFWAPNVLFVAACDAMMFDIWLVFSYESHLHYQAIKCGESNYSRWKYAATLSLGLSAIINFVMGLVMTAVANGVNKVGL